MTNAVFLRAARNVHGEAMGGVGALARIVESLCFRLYTKP